MSTNLTSNITRDLQNIWLAPETAPALAAAQRELVERELQQDAEGKPPPPFAAFEAALASLTAYAAVPILRAEQPLFLLDVGCGVGHYGVLCARRYPTVYYTGTDASAAMIREALVLSTAHNLRAVFQVREWNDNAFEDFDVVLVSQVLEATDDPPAALATVLDRASRFVILHRLRDARLWGLAGRIFEPTYGDLLAYNWLWDMEQVADLARARGEIVYSDQWGSQVTLIVEKTE